MLTSRFRKITGLTLSLVGTMVFSCSSVFAANLVIKDVPATNQYYSQISDVINQKWMDVAAGKFYPDKNITRGEFALILSKFDNDIATIKSVKKSSFTDVNSKEQYIPYIEAEKAYIPYFKVKNGLSFKPKTFITREDAATAIVRAMGYDTQDAMDSGVESEVSIEDLIDDSNKVSLALKRYVSLAVANELINIREDGTNKYFDPKSFITRSQLAYLLLNAQSKADFSKETGEVVVEDKPSVKDDSNTDKSNSAVKTTDSGTTTVGQAGKVSIFDMKPKMDWFEYIKDPDQLKIGDEQFKKGYKCTLSCSSCIFKTNKKYKNLTITYFNNSSDVSFKVYDKDNNIVLKEVHQDKGVKGQVTIDVEDVDNVEIGDSNANTIICDGYFE